MDSATAGIRLAGDYSATPLGDIGYYSSGVVSHANWVNRLRVQNDGNVGIGTSTPSTKLAVEGGSVSTVNSTGTDVRYSFDIRTLVGGAIGFNNAAATNVYGVVT